MARPFAYEAEEILSKFEEYKEYQSKQFTLKPELIKSGERAGEVIYIQVPDPMQIRMFCNFAGIEERTLYNYANKLIEVTENEESEALFQAFTYVYNEITGKQVAGGLNGVYNPMIVARLNGLKDSQEINQTGSVNQAININVNGSEIDITSD